MLISILKGNFHFQNSLIKRFLPQSCAAQRKDAMINSYQVVFVTMKPEETF